MTFALACLVRDFTSYFVCSGAALTRRVASAILGILLLPFVFAAEAPLAGPIEAGHLQSPTKEISGLAASRQSPGLLWTHNDSGGQPVLYAVSEDGAKRGALRISGVKNEDWEDLAACKLDGKSWLVIGDVGDNDAKRSHVVIHVVEEPKRDQFLSAGELSAKPAFSLAIKYEDGARDCESIAVDEAERAIYLLSKRDAVPRLYRVPLVPAGNRTPLIARFVGTVPHIPPPTAAEKKVKGHLGRRRAEVCAMDFAADGSAAVVLTYGAVLYFPRRAGESWADALRHEPALLGAHHLPQAEAACFTPDGRHLYVASETTPNLLRYDRR